eukprot:m51a1_g7499 hypothetical protein (531) ;mRNA; f:262015-263607
MSTASTEPQQAVSLLTPSESSVARARLAGPPASRRPGAQSLCRLCGRPFGRPWMAVAGAVVAMLGLGAQSSWGTLSIFVSDPGLLRGVPDTATIWVFATAGVMTPLVMFVAAPVQRRLGYCATSALGCAVAGCGLAGASLARSVVALALTFGVAFGGAIGLAYVSCVVAAQRWFPRRRGVVGGAVLAAFGASGFMHNMVARALANPGGMPTRCPAGATAEQRAAWEEAFHREMQRTVPHAFLAMGAITLCLGVAGSLFVHLPPDDDPEPVAPAAKQPPSEAEEPQQARRDSNGAPEADTPATTADVDAEGLETGLEASQAPAVDMSPGQMARTPQFWMLYCVVTLGVTASVLVLGSFSQFAKRDAQFDAPFALVGGLAALSNGAGRVAWGYLADLLDYRRVYVADLALLSALLFAYFETRASAALWGVGTCLIFACYGGLLSLLPTATADAFGDKWQSRNYSILFSGLAVGSLAQALLLTSLLRALGSFRKLFYVMGALSSVAAALMVAYKPPGRGRWFALCTTYRRAVR